MVPDESRARQVLDRVRHGADFAAEAAAHSLAPEASEGGLLPPFASGEMPEVFEHAFTLREGQISEGVESPYGFHIFMLGAQFPPREAELETSRETIVARLQGDRLDEQRRLWLRELRRSADLQVNERALEKMR